MAGKTSKSSKKRHLNGIYQKKVENSTFLRLSSLRKMQRELYQEFDILEIVFTREDAEGVIPGHDNPIIITMVLENTNLHRAMIDQGSSENNLFKLAFEKLGLKIKDLRAYQDTLFRLGENLIQPIRYISLYSIFRKGPRSITLKVDYVVLDTPTTYNALIKHAWYTKL